jgi:hypothetical protein
MDKEAENQAIASFERWAKAFNDRDADGMVAEMHFPHMRLANNKFHVWEKPADFHGPQPKMTDNCRRMGAHVYEIDCSGAVEP